MTEVISTRIPNEMAEALEEIEKKEKTDRATTIRKLLAKAIKEWKKEHALQQYREGKITLWRAARTAEITLREMMQLAADQGIPFKYTKKDLEEDIKAAISE